METQPTLFKGELMEERLRHYFLSMGYFVSRGIKYKYENNTLTDVDLFLYGRSSILRRERINVDIKNKKSPQAFERILWANGLMRLLDFNSCIVATSDKRPVITTFGQLHNTTIFDWNFLNKLPAVLPDRIPEEELLFDLSQISSYKTFENKDWATLYEESKSRLLTELDFSGFNSTLAYLHYYLEKAITDERKRKIATKMVYLTISHLLIMMDYIIKDIVYLEQSKKEKIISDGLKFGNLGKEGVDKIVRIAVRISGGNTATEFLSSLQSLPVEILKDYFCKNENIKNMFSQARDFEVLGYKRHYENPNQIDSSLKGVIAVMLDYFKIERKQYFESYNITSKV